jgi:hypothetical protein
MAPGEAALTAPLVVVLLFWLGMLWFTPHGTWLESIWWIVAFLKVAQAAMNIWIHRLRIAHRL